MTMKRFFLTAIFFAMVVQPEWLLAQWTPISTPEGGSVNGLATSNGVLYAGTDAGVYRSANNGQNWQIASDGLGDEVVLSMLGTSTAVFAGTYGGVFRSTDAGNTWQNVSSNSLRYSIVNCFATTGGFIYAGTDFDGVFRSADGGNTWTEVNTGLLNDCVNALAVSGTALFAGTGSYTESNKGLYRSTDNGNTWSLSGSGLPANTLVSAVAALANGTLFAGGDDGFLYRSTDGGGSWSLSRNGVSSFLSMNCFLVDVNNIYVGTTLRVYVSTDGGVNWANGSSGLPSATVNSLLLKDGYFFAGLFELGVYRASGGLAWSAVNTGIYLKLNAFLEGSNGAVYAGTDGGGLFRSTNGGSTWSPLSLLNEFGVENTFINALIETNGALYAASLFGVNRSQDGGITWTDVSAGLPLIKASFALSANGTSLFTGTLTEGIYRSTDNGGNWSAANTGITASSNKVNAMLGKNGNLFAAIFVDGIYRSSNNGESWQPTNLTNQYILSLAASANGIIYAGEYSDGIYRSLDGGKTWIPCALPNNSIPALAAGNGDEVYAASLSGTYRSQNSGATWQVFNDGLPAGVVTGSTIGYGDIANNLYLGALGRQIHRFANPSGGISGTGSTVQINAASDATDYAVAVGGNGAVLRSIDGGGFAPVIGIPSVQTLNGVAASAVTTAKAARANSHKIISERAAQIISELKTTPPANRRRLHHLSREMARLYRRSAYDKPLQARPQGFGSAVAVGVGGTILRSADGGANWSSISSNTAVDLQSVVITGQATTSAKQDAVSGTSGFGSAVAVGVGGTILRTNDDGQNWSQVSSPTANALNSAGVFGSGSSQVKNDGTSSPQGFGSAVAVGVGGTILRSTDAGSSWALIPLTQPTGETLVRVVMDGSAAHAFALGDQGLVLETNDEGLTWQTVNVLSAADASMDVPKEFLLKQNYPNPFNPNTIISYQLSVASEVRLKVFDVLGREVATLVGARQPAGNYRVSFTAQGLSSGVYFYRLQANDFVQTKKMLLVK